MPLFPRKSGQRLFPSLLSPSSRTVPGLQLALDSTKAGLHHPPEPETLPVPPVDDTEKTVDFGAN